MIAKRDPYLISFLSAILGQRLVVTNWKYDIAYDQGFVVDQPSELHKSTYTMHLDTWIDSPDSRIDRDRGAHQTTVVYCAHLSFIVTVCTVRVLLVDTSWSEKIVAPSLDDSWNHWIRPCRGKIWAS